MECSWNSRSETKYYVVIFDQLQGHSGEVIWAPESFIRDSLTSTTSEICPVLLGEPSALKTRMLYERVQVFIPLEQTKSLSIRLPVALQFKRALMEWSLFVSIVLISTGRSKEVSHASNTLIERNLGSLFSHLGL